MPKEWVFLRSEDESSMVLLESPVPVSREAWMFCSNTALHWVPTRVSRTVGPSPAAQVTQLSRVMSGQLAFVAQFALLVWPVQPAELPLHAGTSVKTVAVCMQIYLRSLVASTLSPAVMTTFERWHAQRLLGLRPLACPVRSTARCGPGP